jgi:hypothetical protein
LLTQLGITENFYFNPGIVFGSSAQMPLWTSSQLFPRPTGSVWVKTNYFILPCKIWESGSYPFQNKEQAEEIIRNWKEDIELKKLYNKTEFIYIK